MNDRQLYSRILGIPSPWKVQDDVAMDLSNKEIVVEDASTATKHKCPECGKRCGGCDSRVRRWWHLDTCQLQTMVSARVPCSRRLPQARHPSDPCTPCSGHPRIGISIDLRLMDGCPLVAPMEVASFAHFVHTPVGIQGKNACPGLISIQHFETLRKSKVRVTLDIEAEVPDCVPDNIQRIVTEKADSLNFRSHGFESE